MLKRDNIEVRLNKDGSLDEIIICDPHDNRCLFHLEQMDEHYYWLRAYGFTQDLVAHICATMGKRRGLPIMGEDAQSGKCYPEGVMFDNGSLKEIKGWKEMDAPIVSSDFEWENSHHEDEYTPVEHLTPETTRHTKVLELIEQYGVNQVLNDLMTIYAKGRREPYDMTLVTEVQQARQKFVEAEKAAWKRKFQQIKQETNGDV